MVLRWLLLFGMAFGLDGAPDLEALEGRVKRVVEQANRTTVAILAESIGSTGSGVVVSPEGLILTAAHVVTDLDGTGEAVEEVVVLFEDGEERRAQVLGMNWGRDAAMLKLLGEGPWAFSGVGDSAGLRPGDWVVATGHPLGFDPLRAAPVRFGRVVSKNQDLFLSSDCVLFGAA
ncbi:MAG: serine protease, partial [Verrucomicrobiota bacterium]